jgi:hypothetical protein
MNEFECITCGDTEHSDDYYIVPTVGLVCDACMTTDHHALWDCNNFAHNPDSYDGAPCPPQLNCGHFVPCSYNVGLVFQYFVAWTMVHANSEDEAIDFALEQVLLNDGFDFSKYRDIEVELIE